MPPWDETGSSIFQKLARTLVSQQGMESSSDLEYQFDGTKEIKKFFKVHENVLMKGKTDEKKAGELETAWALRISKTSPTISMTKTLF